MNEAKKCVVCDEVKNLKRGWTNCWYCCEAHERNHVSELHESMPGAGKLPRVNWVPSHISKEISNRWVAEGEL